MSAEWDDLARLAEAAQDAPEWSVPWHTFVGAANPATILRLIASLREARETNQRLHRRAQLAESGVRETVEECRRAGVSLGRMLANSAATHYREAAHAIGQDLAQVAMKRHHLRHNLIGTLRRLNTARDRLAAVEALADEWDRKAVLASAAKAYQHAEVWTNRSSDLRAALAAPTDTTKETS